MKLLLDMNIALRWVEFFRTHGMEAVHWSSVGEPNAPDREIMAFARDGGYIVFTHDLDFSAILAPSRPAQLLRKNPLRKKNTSSPHGESSRKKYQTPTGRPDAKFLRIKRMPDPEGKAQWVLNSVVN
ncbi:MAG: DUF5615 family PIN-like protein [Desulfovibrio sp.]|jgi:predicted nuclease of predicted toxin-antitoxin system|nr:DUF5615 family PIN-like protein [Desulfovibrio sp.]